MRAPKRRADFLLVRREECSTPQWRPTPLIERAFRVGPRPDRSIGTHDLKLGRKFEPIAFRVIDEDEEIIAGAMPARSPAQRNLQFGEPVCPIANRVPVRCLITV